MRRFSRFMGLTTFTALLVYAQDISGEWQGTLKAGPQEIRIVLQIAKRNAIGITAVDHQGSRDCERLDRRSVRYLRT